MIVKGTQDEANVLQRCLAYTVKAVDGIFITATYPKGGKVHQSVWDVCNAYKATTSKFEWINDFAAARNFNFSQVPQDYTHIFWLDADDILKDKESIGLGSNLKNTIEAHPDVDAFSMFYLYAFDEHKNPTVVHQKTRVIKNNGCCTWLGSGIHEELAPTRQINQWAIKGIDIIHLSDEQRLDDSRQRNYNIAKEWITNHPENPTSYFNLANSAFGIGKYYEAILNYDEFLKRSKSDDEKYIVRLRKVDVLYAQHKFQEALEEARYGIGLKPSYPDAYHAAGKLYYHLGLYEQAKDMFLNGLVRPAPVYQIIVYNPRDYDYNPLMNLAKTYYALNLPQLALPALEQAIKIVPADTALKKTIRILRKEAKDGDEILKLAGKLRKITDKVKLKKQLDKVPEKFKFHPEILRIKNTNFIKETSSGKDLVIFCGFTAEEWTPETIAKKGSGGSEEAVITVAQGLADKGWNVTVYNNCGTEEHFYNNITYKPYMSWNYRDKQDVTILWRNVKPLDWDINSTKIFLDMHDVIPNGEFTPSRIDKVSKVFYKSQYHRNLYPQVPDDKVVILPNGIHPEQFSVVEKDPYLMINTASPVRSLTALIPIMKKVRKEVPQAKLQWAYGWVTTDKGMAGEPAYPEWKNNILNGLIESGIEDLGRLTHKQVADLYNRASFYLYPTVFVEIDCMSITKALAAGATPITTDYGAIKEKQGYGGTFIHQPEVEYKPSEIDFSVTDEQMIDKFAKEIITQLKAKRQDSTQMRKYALENYSWNNIINKWNDICTK